MTLSAMIFPDDPDELDQDKEARREFREEWMDILEDKEIAEGDISVSETIDGKDPDPDLDDEDEFENMIDEIEDEADDPDEAF